MFLIKTKSTTFWEIAPGGGDGNRNVQPMRDRVPPGELFQLQGDWSIHPEGFVGPGDPNLPGVPHLRGDTRTKPVREIP